jgi:hypothetical protein
MIFKKNKKSSEKKDEKKVVSKKKQEINPNELDSITGGGKVGGFAISGRTPT